MHLLAKIINFSKDFFIRKFHMTVDTDQDTYSRILNNAITMQAVISGGRVKITDFN